ncbi:MAG TPA: I78 family peptidase inhibitor [Ottowia sp.]|uniref:I78 family peptidase inhibitor n=1 Tax=Ottowia sp. TaxID=1898956 RepID=UPI002CB92D82|nr:I78 family peptidase inhibitor [Ottowia sp.]HMN21288.1 I78 family peptidase inhibitor [Ottowia sp.]
MRLDRSTSMLVLAALPWLAACVNPVAPADAAAPEPIPRVVADRISAGGAPGNHCDARAAQFLVGQRYDDDSLRRALEAAGADEARRLRPDSVITKEYQAGRLNVVVDAGGRVVRVHCG